MSNQNRPLNLRLLDLGHTFEQLAHLARATLDHINSELLYADGYPQSTPGAAPSTHPSQRPAYDERGNLLAPVKLNGVEAAAERAWQLRADRAQIYDDVEACESFAASMRNVMRTAQGTRIARTDLNNGRCYTDPGLTDYLIPRDEGGWSDPACANKSRSKTKPGLCDACRQRLAEHRARNGQKPLDEDRKVEHDSTVRYESDVALVRPISGAA